MDRKIYFWTEDRKDKAGFIFWKTLMQQLYPSVIVESKRNNSELVKAVKNLQDKDNEYIIAFDRSFDNIQAVREHQILQKQITRHENVHELRLICFEYVLLEFDKLIEWVYAPKDELYDKRKEIIEVREKFLMAIKKKQDYKMISELKTYNDKLESMNVEQLTSKLLYDITRNTGFEVSKGKIGECWIRSCCDWLERQEDDICGLDMNKISLLVKMKEIVKHTTLKQEFPKLGLEVCEMEGMV